MRHLSFIAVLGSALVLLLVVVPGCHGPAGEKAANTAPDTTYTLTGDLEGLDSGWVYLLHRQSGNEQMDSALIKDGQFRFTGRADSPEFCNLGAAPNGTKEFYCGFFLQNGKINLIGGRKDQLNDAQVFITGSPAEDDYKEFLEGKRKIDSVGNFLQQYYGYAREKKDQRLLDSLIPLLYAQYDEQRQLVKNFARLHPSSCVSAFVVYTRLGNDPGPGELDSLYKGMNAAVQASFFGRKLRAAMDEANKTAIGSPAPDLVVNDIHDKPVALASFRGKYTLVDFWASWCGPCRAENPNVVKTYRRYHPKGFAILGVSLDEQKSNWEKAIQKDKLVWTQVSDLKGWESSAAALYGVKAIPMNFLLDKDGKILGKGLRGKALDDKLAAIFP